MDILESSRATLEERIAFVSGELDGELEVLEELMRARDSIASALDRAGYRTDNLARTLGLLIDRMRVSA